MSQLRNKKISVVGMGLAGIAAMKFLNKQGAKVKGFDYLVPQDLARAEAALKGTNTDLVIDPSRGPELLDSDMVVLTPGGKHFEKFYEEARAKKIPVFTDMELACLYYKAPIIAITGSNGKSTVMSMIKTVFEAAGKKVKLAGGEYDHFLEAVTAAPLDYYLLEVSSTRLQKARKFKPFMSIFLNLYPGHGERHATIEEYGKAKAKIFAQQGPEDFAIYQFSPDVVGLVMSHQVKARRFRFSLEEELKYGAFYSEKGSEVIFRVDKKESRFPLKNFAMPGPQNLENLMATICAAKLCGIADDSIRKSIETLRPLSRRLELFHKADGVKFYDDSRAVNAMATLQSLKAFPDHSVILIAGGDYIRQQFYKILRPILEKKARGVIIFGHHRERFFKKWEGTAEIYMVVTIEEAVQVAINMAEKGNVVLFSPAARPDPTVHNSEPQRSQIFREAVLKAAGMLQARRTLSFKV